ncbi:MAG: hypothetical protein Q8P18_15040 [Pseudomonadota bacterium]|nr:hypothetical protein [Pseudomonadota bacterium]
MNRSMLAFLPLLAIGCATPTSGDYLFEETASTSDCPEVEDTGGEPVEAEPVAVLVSEDKATVTIYEIDFPLEGTSFEGVMFDEETDYNSSGLDAIVAIYSDIAGTWVSSSKISGTSTFETSCTGTYCADLEAAGAAFCSGSTDWDATLQE